MLNLVQLIGNLGASPELAHTHAGQSVCTISLATSRRWLDRSGELHDETEWHRVVLWGKTAEAVAAHKRKGDQLYIAGRLRTRAWDAKDGAKRWTTEIVAERCQFLGKKRGTDARDTPPPSDDDAPPPSAPIGDDIPF